MGHVYESDITLTDGLMISYSLDCREGHMKKNRLFVCMSVCIKVKRTSVLETHNS